MKDLTLNSISEQCNITIRELRQAVLKQLIDDENISKRILEAQNHAIQGKQLELMNIQLHNEAMENALLKYKLQRKMYWMEKKEKFTKLFKKNGRKEGIGKD